MQHFAAAASVWYPMVAEEHGFKQQNSNHRPDSSELAQQKQLKLLTDSKRLATSETLQVSPTLRKILFIEKARENQSEPGARRGSNGISSFGCEATSHDERDSRVG